MCESGCDKLSTGGGICSIIEKKSTGSPSSRPRASSRSCRLSIRAGGGANSNCLTCGLCSGRGSRRVPVGTTQKQKSSNGTTLTVVRSVAQPEQSLCHPRHTIRGRHQQPCRRACCALVSFRCWTSPLAAARRLVLPLLTKAGIDQGVRHQHTRSLSEADFTRVRLRQ